MIRRKANFSHVRSLEDLQMMLGWKVKISKEFRWIISLITLPSLQCRQGHPTESWIQKWMKSTKGAKFTPIAISLPLKAATSVYMKSMEPKWKTKNTNMIDTQTWRRIQFFQLWTDTAIWLRLIFLKMTSWRHGVIRTVIQNLNRSRSSTRNRFCIQPMLLLLWIWICMAKQMLMPEELRLIVTEVRQIRMRHLRRISRIQLRFWRIAERQFMISTICRFLRRAIRSILAWKCTLLPRGSTRRSERPQRKFDHLAGKLASKTPKDMQNVNNKENILKRFAYREKGTAWSSREYIKR